MLADRSIVIQEVKESLSSVLTLPELERVQMVLWESLSHYQLTKTDRDDEAESEDLLEAFLTAKSTEGRSESTIKHYRYVVHRYLEMTNTSLSRTTVYVVRDYLKQLKEDGLKDKTRQNIRNVLSSLFAWLTAEHLIPDNPCSNLGEIKTRKVLRYPFSPTDIDKIKEACTTTRDRALIEFLMSTGCRISEVTSLNRSDINFAKMSVDVLGKGNKERTVYINEVTTMWLQKYFEERTDNSKALFAGRGTKRITPNGVRFMMSELEVRTGVDNIHPHRFRRTLATHLINRGMPIQEVARILGHDNIQTTLGYVCIDERNVRNSYDRYTA